MFDYYTHCHHTGDMTRKTKFVHLRCNIGRVEDDGVGRL